MPRYRVTGAIVGSKYLGEVEADTLEQALEMADQKYLGEPISLCHECASECEDGCVDLIEVDEIKS